MFGLIQVYKGKNARKYILVIKQSLLISCSYQYIQDSIYINLASGKISSGKIWSFYKLIT
jgi:hypothetical protein